MSFLYCLVQQDKVLFMIIIMYILGGGNILSLRFHITSLAYKMLWIQQVLIMASKDLALVSKQNFNA